MFKIGIFDVHDISLILWYLQIAILYAIFPLILGFRSNKGILQDINVIYYVIDLLRKWFNLP